MGCRMNVDNEAENAKACLELNYLHFAVHGIFKHALKVMIFPNIDSFNINNGS